MGAHEQVVQAQPAAGRQQFGGGDQREPGDRAPLAREPALPWQPLPQQWIERGEEAWRVVTVRVTASDMASRPFPGPVGVLLMRAPGGAGETAPPELGQTASLRSRNQ